MPHSRYVMPSHQYMYDQNSECAPNGTGWVCPAKPCQCGRKLYPLQDPCFQPYVEKRKDCCRTEAASDDAQGGSGMSGHIKCELTMDEEFIPHGGSGLPEEEGSPRIPPRRITSEPLTRPRGRPMVCRRRCDRGPICGGGDMSPMEMLEALQPDEVVCDNPSCYTCRGECAVPRIGGYEPLPVQQLDKCSGHCNVASCDPCKRKLLRQWPNIRCISPYKSPPPPPPPPCDPCCAPPRMYKSDHYPAYTPESRRMIHLMCTPEASRPVVDTDLLGHPASRIADSVRFCGIQDGAIPYPADHCLGKFDPMTTPCNTHCFPDPFNPGQCLKKYRTPCPGPCPCLWTCPPPCPKSCSPYCPQNTCRPGTVCMPASPCGPCGSCGPTCCGNCFPCSCEPCCNPCGNPCGPPCGPCGPCGGSPCSPCGSPCAPCGTPCGPCGPESPGRLIGPCVPRGVCTPIGPCGVPYCPVCEGPCTCPIPGMNCGQSCPGTIRAGRQPRSCRDPQQTTRTYQCCVDSRPKVVEEEVVTNCKNWRQAPNPQFFSTCSNQRSTKDCGPELLTEEQLNMFRRTIEHPQPPPQVPECRSELPPCEQPAPKPPSEGSIRSHPTSVPCTTQSNAQSAIDEMVTCPGMPLPPRGPKSPTQSVRIGPCPASPPAANGCNNNSSPRQMSPEDARANSVHGCSQ